MDSNSFSAMIRPARVSDAPGIAHVLVDTYIDTYRGLLQDSTLKRLSIPGRSTRWEQVISSHGSDIVLVAVDDETGLVLGYAYGGTSRDPALPDGELYQLYVHPKAQGQHIGERLFLQFARTLWMEDYVSMIVNVLDGSRSIHFYERHGGVSIGSHMTTVDGKNYSESTYRWPDLDDFMD